MDADEVRPLFVEVVQHLSELRASVDEQRQQQEEILRRLGKVQELIMLAFDFAVNPEISFFQLLYILSET